MRKTRASFHIAEDDQPLGKRPRRSCKATTVLKELGNVPKSRTSKELKKAPKLKSKELDNAPRSRSKRTRSEDEAPKKRSLPNRKGRGVPPLRLQEQIMGQEEDDEEEEEKDDGAVAQPPAEEVPKRRSSSRIQKQNADTPAKPEKPDYPFKQQKQQPKYQKNTKNDSKRKKMDEVEKMDTETKLNKLGETEEKKMKLDKVVETLVETAKKEKKLSDDNSRHQRKAKHKVKIEPEHAETVEVEPEPQQNAKGEVRIEPQSGPSTQEESSLPAPKVQTRLRPRPLIKVRFVDDDELSCDKRLVIDFIAPSAAPLLRTPITAVHDDYVVPMIDLEDEVRKHLSAGRTTLEEVHRACMGLEMEKLGFQPRMPERPKMIDDIEAADREQEEKLRELRKNLKAEAPECDCGRRGRALHDSGPYYTHLGTACSEDDIRRDFENKGFEKKNIRIETVINAPREGKSSQGCPIAKYVVRRSSEEEKILVVVKHRKGHDCATAWIVVSIVMWEAIPAEMADTAYTKLSYKMGTFGFATQRRCGTNSAKLCACQGWDDKFGGASFSFGCSWSHFYDLCKFNQGGDNDPAEVRKFKLNTSGDRNEERELGDLLEEMATHLSPLYKRLAPDSHANQVAFETMAPSCRIGRPIEEGRPFSGVTAVSDFCAHAHFDNHNMNAGCTVIVTLTKKENRPLGARPSDEQLHVLPLYVLDKGKAKQGPGLDVLTEYAPPSRVRKVPLKKCAKKNMPSTKEQLKRQGFLQLDGAGDRAAAGSSTRVTRSSTSPTAAPQKKLIHAMAATDKENIVDIGGYFKDDSVGGLAVALTHGSVMLECAKLELHATTALKEPDRFNPTRIGLVFYQHRRLTYANHGKQEWDRRSYNLDFQRYERWCKGEEMLTEKRVAIMRRAGFRFPDNVATIKWGTNPKKADIPKPISDMSEPKPGNGQLPHSYWNEENKNVF